MCPGGGTARRQRREAQLGYKVCCGWQDGRVPCKRTGLDWRNVGLRARLWVDSIRSLAHSFIHSFSNNVLDAE